MIAAEEMAGSLSGPLVGHRHLDDPVSVAARRELRVGDRTVIAISDGYLNLEVAARAHPDRDARAPDGRL